MDRLQEEAAKAENRTPYGSCLQAAVIGYVKEKDGVTFVKKEAPPGIYEM